MSETILRSSTADRLRHMNRRSCAWPDERDDIALALQVLSPNPADSDVDHPLVDLYGALHFSARTNGMIYLSREDCHLLAEVIIKMEGANQ
jgi:hypothetical protein